MVGLIVKWFTVLLFAVGAILVVLRVGKPRGPITPTEAALAMLYNLMMMAAIIVWWETP